MDFSAPPRAAELADGVRTLIEAAIERVEGQ